MNRIKLITDSTCDLTDELLEKYNIEVLPLTVNFSNQSYFDRVTINTKELYEIINERNEFPKTAAVTILQFEEVFKKYVNLGYDVIYMGLSKSMSRTYENAKIAQIEISEEHIYVIDSMNLSTGISLLLLKACKYISLGLKASEIYSKLLIDRSLVYSQFIIDTLKFLHMGGRCTGVAAFIGSALSLKPIIAVRDGKMHVQKKPIGLKRGYSLLLDQIKKDKDRLDLDNIFITHSFNEKASLYFKKELQKEFPNANIIITNAGCVISSHCGKGTIGILYMINDN